MKWLWWLMRRNPISARARANMWKKYAHELEKENEELKVLIVEIQKGMGVRPHGPIRCDAIPAPAAVDGGGVGGREGDTTTEESEAGMEVHPGDVVSQV